MAPEKGERCEETRGTDLSTRWDVGDDGTGRDQWAKDVAIDVAVGIKEMGTDLAPTRVYRAGTSAIVWNSVVCDEEAGSQGTRARNAGMGDGDQPGGSGRLEYRWESAAGQSPRGSAASSGAGSNQVAQTLKRVMGQQIAEGGDQTEATLQLLRAVPLQGKLVTLDAGLLHREVANTIVEQGGNYLGPVKGNEAGVKEAVDEWIEAKISPPGCHSPSGSDRG